MNILLIEDNLTIIKGLKYNLELNNYKVEYKTTLADAKEYIKDNHVDLIILDVTLPDGNGFTFYEENVKNIPTIFLTAMDDEDNIVKGLNLGAEDYLTKPFSTKELLARINRILLKSKKLNIVKIKDIEYDYNKMLVKKDNKKIDLSSIELQLLNLLMINKNKVVSRDFILDKIWDITGNEVDNHTVTVYFKRIREKLGTDIIKTVKGIGYRIDEE